MRTGTLTRTWSTSACDSLPRRRRDTRRSLVGNYAKKATAVHNYRTYTIQKRNHLVKQIGRH